MTTGISRRRPATRAGCTRQAGASPRRRRAALEGVDHLLRRLVEVGGCPDAPARDPRRGWIDEIVDFRGGIAERLTPILHRDLKRQLNRLYDRARRNLQRKLERYGETIRAARFPDRCPYNLDQVLGHFWPAERDG